MPSRRAIQRSCVARMSAALGSKTSNTNWPPSASSDAAARQGAAALRVAREVHERAEGRDHAVARRQRRRIAQVAEHRLEQVADAAGGWARRSRLGEHRGRGVERDHAVAVPRELDRDAAAARAELDDRARRALAGEHVERRCRGRRRRTSGRRAARAARRAPRPVLLLRVAHAVEWRLRRRRRRVGGRRPGQGAGP